MDEYCDYGILPNSLIDITYSCKSGGYGSNHARKSLIS